MQFKTHFRSAAMKRTEERYFTYAVKKLNDLKCNQNEEEFQNKIDFLNHATMIQSEGTMKSENLEEPLNTLDIQNPILTLMVLKHE